MENLKSGFKSCFWISFPKTPFRFIKCPWIGTSETITITARPWCEKHQIAQVIEFALGSGYQVGKLIFYSSSIKFFPVLISNKVTSVLWRGWRSQRNHFIFSMNTLPFPNLGIKNKSNVCHLGQPHPHYHLAKSMAQSHFGRDQNMSKPIQGWV